MINLSKIGGFFEAHIEKMILVIVGIVCAWLLITRVIFSPNEISYGDEKYSPGSIDEKVLEEANLLRQRLNDPPEKQEPYKPKFPEFAAKFDSSISDINTSLWPLAPYAVSDVVQRQERAGDEGRGGRYRLPRIGNINEVAVEHIRAAAYVPTVPVTEQVPYRNATNEPNDIDLVTVEAKFNVEELYNNFRYSFIDDVAREWADPCLAKPVFASVQLQRQELGENGTWGDWQDVPRTKIDQNRQLFETIQTIDDDLSASRLKLWKLQFENIQLQIDLLQPEAYQIASAKEEWFPPVLHRKFIDYQKRETLLERQEARREEAEERDRDRDRDDSRTNTRRSSRSNRRDNSRTGVAGRSGRGGDGLGGDAYGGAGADSRRRSSRTSNRRGSSDVAGGGRTRRGRGEAVTDGRYDPLTTGDRTVRTGPTTDDVYFEFQEISLNALTDFSKMEEPLVFWAHDDTIEPRKTYRYRIRLGVFNPVAGTNQLSERDSGRKDEVILWSGFSDVTEPVTIPGWLYFFAKNIREADDVVTVQVSKYLMGYWRTEDFRVSKGDAVGGVVEYDYESESETETVRPTAAGRGNPAMMMNRINLRSPVNAEEAAVKPEEIDYGTGAVIVDIVPVTDWAKENNLTNRHYYDMLYSIDGNKIEHMPVRSSYWAQDLQEAFRIIPRMRIEEIEPLKAFGSRGRGRGGYERGGGYMDEMMMFEGGGRGRGPY